LLFCIGSLFAFEKEKCLLKCFCVGLIFSSFLKLLSLQYPKFLGLLVRQNRFYPHVGILAQTIPQYRTYRPIQPDEPAPSVFSASVFDNYFILFLFYFYFIFILFLFYFYFIFILFLFYFILFLFYFILFYYVFLIFGVPIRNSRSLK
jgi:hypothetical protein